MDNYYVEMDLTLTIFHEAGNPEIKPNEMMSKLFREGWLVKSVKEGSLLTGGKYLKYELRKTIKREVHKPNSAITLFQVLLSKFL